ncbi:MAG: hypothetical protein NC079_10740 [Clostridium sp.]|nr:hypothetical protein [Acetatifactor muris]MCM1525780.1 hypothetical protein [Bacteroides sp.]MCM1564066.1 hypothetical protein [Clostridium sp.]
MQEKRELSESDFQKILWNYFAMHAGQRIQILNFYIVLETFFITGLLTLFQLSGDLTVFRLILSFSVIFFSFVFYALDKRTKEMIKFSEDALKTIEQKYESEYSSEIMIFSKEQEKTLFERRWSWLAKNFLSYSKLFKLIYLFFGIIGILGMVMEIINILPL